MSYHVDLPGIDPEHRSQTTAYSVGTLAGGVGLGPVFEIVVNGEAVLLTRQQQKHLRQVLKYVKNNHGTLYGYPGAS